MVAVKSTQDGRRFIRHDPKLGFVNACLVDDATPWPAETEPPPPGWKIEPRPLTTHEMAHALHWAAEWADLDQPGEVDASYIDGVRETIGHQLACWLVQSAGWEFCETAVAVDLIPWEEAPRWSVDQWQAFLLRTARENR